MDIMIKVSKATSVLSFTLIFLLSRNSTKAQVRNKIVYNAFPEMEKKICNEIKFRFNNRSDSVYLVIQPYSDNKGNFDRNKFSLYLVPFEYPKQFKDDVEYIARNSNRQMLVCNNYIPVYIDYIDQLFTLESGYIRQHKGLSGPTWYGYSLGGVDIVKEKFD
jgi:hypothetical protein